MNCTPYPVHPALKRFVKGYFLMRSEDANMEILTANPYAGLLFHIGSQHNAPIQYDFGSQSNDKQILCDDQHLWLCGMHNQPIKSQYGAATHLFFVISTPLGIQHLLKGSLTLTLNNSFSFENLGLKQPFDGLAEQLQVVQTDMEAVQLVESYLLNYYNRLQIPFSVKDMRPVMEYICRNKGMVKVAQLEDKFRVSRRWLELQFASQIGFSPKEFARLIRFKAILAEATGNPSISWGSIIETYGYYDQSHLIRDFQSFTGKTPKQYFKDSMIGLNSVANSTLELYSL